MIRIIFMLFVAICMSLGGCSQRPFATSSPDIPSPRGLEVVSMCYHAHSTTREEVMKLAARKCKKEGYSVEFWRHDKTFNDCPILAKTRVSFFCIAPN